MNVLNPTPQLLSKLGSLIVHADEYTSVNGHDLDRQALRSLLDDPEVKQWLKNMSEIALLPLKRENDNRGRG